MKPLLVSILLFFCISVTAQQKSLLLVQEVLELFNKGEYTRAIPVAEQAVETTKAEMGENSPFHSGMMLFLGMSHWSLFHYTEAETWLTRCNDIHLKYLGERSEDYQAGLNRLANLQLELGKYSLAESTYRKVLDITRAVYGVSDTSYAKVLNNLASLYRVTGQYTLAEKLYLEARGIIGQKSGEQSALFATCLNNLSTIYSDLGQFQKAKPLLLRVADIRKSVSGGKDPDYAQCLNNLGFLYASLGEYKEAEQYYIRARDIYSQSLGEQHPDYATTIDNLASLYGRTGEYEKARGLFLQSLEIRKNTVGMNHADYAQSLNNLAGFYESAGQYNLAEQYFQEAMEKTENNLGKLHPYYVTTLNNLATLYHTQGLYVKAEPLYQLAAETRKKLLGANHPNYAMSLNNQATLYHEMGQLEKAEKLYRQSAEIWERSLGTRHPDYAMSLNNQAALYEDQLQYEKAEPLYIQAMKIRKEVFGENHTEYANSLNNLSGLYARMGRYNQAEALILQANAIWKSAINDNNPNIALGLNNLAAVYRKGQYKYEQAEQLYLQSIDRRKRQLGEGHPLTADTENDLALLYMNMKQFKKAEPYLLASSLKAIRHLQNSFPVLSEKEKGNFINDNLFFNDCNNSFLYNYPAASPAILHNNVNLQLFFKSLSLADTRNMLDALRDNRDPEIKKLAADWQVVKTLLATQYALPVSKRMKNLEEKEAEAENLEKELNRKSVEFRRQQSALRITSKEVRQHLGEGEAAIEFVNFRYYNKRQTDSVIYAAYIMTSKDSTPVFVPLFEELQLQQLFSRAGATATRMVSSFYRGSEIKNKNPAAALGSELYRLVWNPLEPYLKGINKISYSPAGKLYSIAFHALPVDSSSVLMDKYRLYQYTSIRQLGLDRPDDKVITPQSIVLFGDATFSLDSLQIVKSRIKKEGISAKLPALFTETSRGRGTRGEIWDNLPGTAQEIQAIRQLFDQKKISTRTLTQTDASEENLKALSGHSPQVLHIATHGFFLPPQANKTKSAAAGGQNAYKLADDPLLRSGLILAGGNYTWGGKAPIQGVEDGIVTAYEISQLNLSQTELVVLSACETALGEVKSSEGVFGLQRAFKMAGVKKMIVSLWQVPDKETAELMTGFYSYWTAGSSATEAFARAQSEMRKKYAPFFWAAFVLVE